MQCQYNNFCFRIFRFNAASFRWITRIDVFSEAWTTTRLKDMQTRVRVCVRASTNQSFPHRCKLAEIQFSSNRTVGSRRRRRRRRRILLLSLNQNHWPTFDTLPEKRRREKKKRDVLPRKWHVIIISTIGNAILLLLLLLVLFFCLFFPPLLPPLLALDLTSNAETDGTFRTA